MIDINRIYGIDIELDNLKEFAPTVEFKQYDYQTSFIAFRFYKKGNLVENIGDNYIIGVFKDEDGGLFLNADGTPVRTYALRYEEEKGVVILPISREVINKAGTVSCEIVIVNEEGKKVTSPRFTFTIHPSLTNYKLGQEKESVCGTFISGEKLCGYGNPEMINISKYITYEKTTWVDGETVVNEKRLNNMEDGIYNVCQQVNSHSETLEEHAREIEWLKENGGSGSNGTYISSTTPENVIVPTGNDLDLNIDFYSSKMGKGTLKVFINDVESKSISINQGESSNIIEEELFTKGTNRMVVYVVDRAGNMSNSLIFNVRYGSTEITTTFDAYSAYDLGSVIRFYFTAKALDTSDTLKMYMKINDELQEPINCQSDIRAYFTFPNTLGVGSHYCETWVEDSKGKSNVIKFNLVIIDEKSLVVASDTRNVTVEEGEQVSLDYKVYMKNNTSFITKTYVDSKLVNTGTCNLEKTYYKTSSLKEGVHTIKVEVWDVTETVMDYVSWTVTITESTYALKEPISSGSIAMFSAQNKSNSDENKEVWIGKNQDNETVMATLHNFAFNSESGWVDDALLITGNSYVEVPFSPLKNNAKYGFTLDIEFVSKMIGVEDAEVLNLWNDVDNCGVKITTEKLIIRSKAGNECNLYFTDNENVSAIFVIDRDEKVAKIYINGVMCGAFALSDYVANGIPYLEDFEVENTIKLGGSGYCIIKNLRVYEVALTSDEILNNFISNETNKSAQKELVDFQKGDDLPTLTIYGDFSGLGKDDKKPCKIVYLSPDPSKYGESFTLDHKESTLQYQGTSSMAYPIKNYRINLRDENGKKWKYNPFNDGKGESRFTLKADFMSSGHWQNTGLAKWVNDNLYKYDTKDEKSMNPRKWYDINNGGKLSDTRETINGFPCRLILVNDGDTPLNEGQAEPTCGNTKDMGVFNFNSDKDNTDTFGLDTDIFPNAMSFEVTANSDTSAGAFVPFVYKKRIGFRQNGGEYNTGKIPIFLPKGNTIKYECPVRSVIRFYNDNTQLSQVIHEYGVTYSNITVPSDTTHIFFVMYGSVPEEIMFDSVPYECVIAPNGSTSLEEIYTKADELEYLQNSFELRYPDSDDVGSDYGYLGLPRPEYFIYEKGGTQWISIEHLGTRDLLIEYDLQQTDIENFGHLQLLHSDGSTTIHYTQRSGSFRTFEERVTHFRFYGQPMNVLEYIKFNGVVYWIDRNTTIEGNKIKDDPIKKDRIDTNYGLKRVIDWVGNCTDEEFLADYEKYFNKQYLLRYYLLVITLGMVDNLGKNMMLDTWDGQIWYPRFYDMDTICSYDNSGAIKFDVDIEMEQGYWNTSSSRLWTKVRDLLHDELVEVYKEMRSNGLSYESLMNYFYGEQISKIPQKYYNMDADIKYLPYADQYLGKAHGDGYEHLKRWLKNRLIFTDTLFDYAPSYNNDVLTIRANTIEPMTLTIETYTPVYQHLSWYNGQMDKKKIDGKTAITFTGSAQTSTDQEVLIYGGSNIKKISGISSMNPNQMLIGSATRLVELDAPDCPLLTDINSNKANLSSHTYLNKLNLSNCPQLGGTLRLNNSQLIKDINVKGTTITSVQMPKSIRNLETLRLPNSIKELKLEDAGVLNTLEFDAGVELESISMTNCNALDNCINFDLTKTPKVMLDNSYNTEELYMSATTDLTLKNMSNLERVIYTPNSEYDEFDISNVVNGSNYKITTFNNPKLTDFITTAPHRLSYKNGDYGDIKPNTVFCANTLDLSDTQFTDVKLLCTTDLYKLKVPTTLKNFYCDSAMDIDTDVITDANYEVIHDELIEEYTTDYEGEVYRHEDVSSTLSNGEGMTFYRGISTNNAFGFDEYGFTITTDGWLKYYWISDFYPIAEGSMCSIVANQYVGLAFFDENKTMIEKYNIDANPQVKSLTAKSPSGSAYVVFSGDMGHNCVANISFTQPYTPNIIPSSANGSLIFNMYSNNTTQPTSISPYMWDLTGLKLEDFYTYGMNNWVKPSDDSYERRVTSVKKISKWSVNSTLGGSGVASVDYIALTPMIFKEGVTTVNFKSDKKICISAQWNDTTRSGQSTWATEVGIAFNGDQIKYRNVHLFFMEGEGSYIEITTNLGDSYKIVMNELEDIRTDILTSDEVYAMSSLIEDERILTEIKSITMPQRMPGYSVRLVNADITPNEYPTMLYPKFIDTSLPITGKLDYTKYNGTSLAWAYAYTTGDVTINPLGSREYGNITNDYNKLYETDFVDIVDVWIYKDTDVSSYSENENITKAYIELTSDNYRTRIDEVLAYYPNCKDLYLFEDGSVTSLQSMFNGSNEKHKGQIETVTFMEGYFENLISMTYTFINMKATHFYNIPDTVNTMMYTFQNCYKLEYVSNFPANLINAEGCLLNAGSSAVNGFTNIPHLPSTVTNIKALFSGCTKLNEQIDLSHLTNLSNQSLVETFKNCSSLAYTPILPSNYSGSMATCFYGCSSLVTAPILPDGVTALNNTFNGCTSLTVVPNIPSACTNYNNTFSICTSLETVPSDGWKGNVASIFTGCSKLNCQINIESATTIERTFYNCTSLSITPSLPSNANCTMASCFEGCTSLVTPPTTPEGVTNMQNCYRNCTELVTAPNIPSSVKNIVAIVYNCSRLTSITIPLDTVETYGNALYNCTSLTDVTWKGLRNKNLWLNSDGLYAPEYTQTDIKELVPEHLDDLYKDKISISFKNKTITINNKNTTWE